MKVGAALLVIATVAALALLFAGLLYAPDAVERGWLIAFLIWSSAPLGAAALALIHVTTGGRWAVAAAPTLRAAAGAALLAPFVFAPLLIGLARVYPWAAHASAASSDFARFYLNPVGYSARGLIVSGALAVIGYFVATGRLNLLGAALSLVFYEIAVSLVAVDWGLSLDPRYSNSAFAAELAVQQLMLALALTAALQPRRAIAYAQGDIGGLLLATTLGALYLALMTFIVKWYGDQPADAAWTLSRANGLAFVWLLGALVFGAFLPLATLSWKRVRENPRALAAAGASVALGIALHDLWWMAADGRGALAAALALIALISLTLLFLRLASGFLHLKEIGP